jgi:hypothetical protein
MSTDINLRTVIPVTSFPEVDEGSSRHLADRARELAARFEHVANHERNASDRPIKRRKRHVENEQAAAPRFIAGPAADASRFSFRRVGHNSETTDAKRVDIAPASNKEAMRANVHDPRTLSTSPALTGSGPRPAVFGVQGKPAIRAVALVDSKPAIPAVTRVDSKPAIPVVAPSETTALSGTIALTDTADHSGKTAVQLSNATDNTPTPPRALSQPVPLKSRGLSKEAFSGVRAVSTSTANDIRQPKALSVDTPEPPGPSEQTGIRQARAEPTHATSPESRSDDAFGLVMPGSEQKRDHVHVTIAGAHNPAHESSTRDPTAMASRIPQPTAEPSRPTTGTTLTYTFTSWNGQLHRVSAQIAAGAAGTIRLVPSSQRVETALDNGNSDDRWRVERADSLDADDEKDDRKRRHG